LINHFGSRVGIVSIPINPNRETLVIGDAALHMHLKGLPAGYGEHTVRNGGKKGIVCRAALRVATGVLIVDVGDTPSCPKTIDDIVGGYTLRSGL